MPNFLLSKPFAEYKSTDWVDVPVLNCSCLYCKVFPEYHPEWKSENGAAYHSQLVKDAFGETGGILPQEEDIFKLEAIKNFTQVSMSLDEAHEIVANNVTLGTKEPKKKSPTAGDTWSRMIGLKFLYLIRGIPGSGKSTLAAMIRTSIQRICGYNTFHFEADDFFVNQLTGEYLFLPEKLAEAHAYCQKSAEFSMENEKGIVIVSNTFVYRAHLEPYLKMAKKYGYTPIEITCNGNFKSIHEVPPETIRKMKQNFER